MATVTAGDVHAAAMRLRPHVLCTPLLESLPLNLQTGCRILVKCECLQTGGSFKLRGALHRVLRLSHTERARGVVAFSSGNFGQGLAAACGQVMDPPVRCTIVMPGDTPFSKQERARSYGADVVLSDIVEGVNREVTAAELAIALSRREGFTLLHPFEDLDVIAGQGSCAVEILDQLRGMGIDSVDALVIPTGGGGLASGCALAINAATTTAARGSGDQLKLRRCPVWAVEPAGYDDHARSFAAGTRIALEGNPPSLCDSLQAVSPGKNTFPITQRLLEGALVVDDEEVREAMRVAFDTLRIVLEPGGAAGLAAVLAGKLPFDVRGKTVVVVASGGNLNLDKFGKILGYHHHAKL